MRKSSLALALLLLCCGDDDDRASDAGMGPLLDAAGSDGGDAALACTPAAQAVEVASALHVAGDIVYPDPPPAGGNHNQCWGTWGVHERELPDERFVHNLEHGGVVYLYRCPDGCADEVAWLSEFVRGRDRALVTPYAALPTRFGIVSWGHRLLSDCLNAEIFERFYSEHHDQGLESISAQPPADCR